VTVCLYPHYATNVERENELAHMMESVDVAVLSLTLDTAHTVLGGQTRRPRLLATPTECTTCT
jgi:hypothetical protein